MKDLGTRTAPADTEATLMAVLEAADRLHEWVNGALGEVGLSYPKYEVLRCLRGASYPMSLGALAECQHCARSNITQLVDRLEGDGLVRRVDDPEDRRGVRAEQPPAGTDHARQGDAQIAAVHARFAASYTAAERVQLAELLSRIQ